MKSLQIPLTVALAFALGACATPKNDSVARAEQINEIPPHLVSREAADFVVEAVDARRMDYREGTLAAERGTTQAVRDYGARMMKDQAVLLEKLNALATAQQIAVPTVLGKAKADGLADLLEKSGEAFDRQFVRMITRDHERDVGEFRRAAKLEDAAIAEFAAAYLPTIESHLEGVKELDRQLDEKR